jgi:predicted site-specific integrase-resolvase
MFLQKKQQKNWVFIFQTLRNWDREGKIKTIRSPGGKRFYDVKSFLEKTDKYDKDNDKIEEEKDERKKICYCRVSSYSQKEELMHQIDYMKLKYPEHEILTDIGSGINFNRGNLKKIINFGIKNNLEELVIAYKDRLCRIGYDLIEYILKEYSNTKIIIEKDEDKSLEKELTEDLLEIITVFSSRLYGMRSYKIPEKDKKYDYTVLYGFNQLLTNPNCKIRGL